MKKIVVLVVSCAFIFLTSLSCFKLPLDGIRLEFDSPGKETPTNPHNILSIDGVSVNLYGNAPTVVAKDADGNTIPVLKEGAVVSAGNVPSNSPTGKMSGDFIVVVVKQDSSGYAAGLIKSTLDATNNDVALGSWVDESGASVLAGITTGKSNYSTVPDGQIYLGDANKKVMIASKDYFVDEAMGQINTVFFIGRWFNGSSHDYYFYFDSSGAYRNCYVLSNSPQCFFDGTWTWNGKDIQLEGTVNIFLYGTDGREVNSNFGDPILENVSIDSATAQFRADFRGNTIHWDLAP